MTKIILIILGILAVALATSDLPVEDAAAAKFFFNWPWIPLPNLPTRPPAPLPLPVPVTPVLPACQPAARAGLACKCGTTTPAINCAVGDTCDTTGTAPVCLKDCPSGVVATVACACSTPPAAPVICKMQETCALTPTPPTCT